MSWYHSKISTMKFLILLFFVIAVNSEDSCSSSCIDLPCGTFVAYNSNQQDLVIKYGFSAGTFSDGSQAYVGHAINAACAGEYNCPARLSVTGSKQGAFMACQNQHHDMVGMRFLLNHPDLKWIRPDTDNLMVYKNLVKVSSTQKYLFHIGRYNLTNPYGSTYTVVSKVYGNNVMSYSLGNGHTNVNHPEILSC
ncbi:uncharacterized protein [Chironomus tepperi]|uniref:uncharacterized protein n=1 Tax=Chironomus tepperi TaxID=113505 RepID=UPI00391F0AA6